MLQESIFEPSKSDTRDKTEAECLAALRSYLPAQLRLVMGKKRSEIMIMIMMMMMIMMIMMVNGISNKLTGYYAEEKSNVTVDLR